MARRLDDANITTPPGITLQTQLRRLTLAAMLPVVLVAGAGLWFLTEAERSTFRRGIEEQAKALLTAVDAELNSTVSTLRAMALDDGLNEGNLPQFHVTASRVKATRSDWRSIQLASADGRIILDTRTPPGTPPTAAGDPESVERAAVSNRPTIGAIFADDNGTFSFAVRVPLVDRAGRVRVLSAKVKPDAIFALLLAQGIPPDWTAVVVDGNGRFIARTVAMQQRLGTPASVDLRTALQRSASGYLEGVTLEGTRVFTAHHTSSSSGWSVAIGVPVASVTAYSRNTLLGFAVATITALLSALALAWWHGRRIAEPICALADVATALARGDLVAIPPASGSREVAQLGAALAQTSAAVQARAEVEQQLAAITNNATMALFMLGTRQECTFANAAAERLTGYTFAEVAGRPLHDVLLPTGGREILDAAAQSPLSRALSEFQPRQGIDELLHKDGHTYPVAFSITPLHIGQSIAGAVVEVRDIRQERDADAARQALLAEESRARRLAEESNRAKDEFLAMLGHELRNPLSAIVTAAELIDRQDNPGSRTLVEVIQRQSAQLRRLVDDLLDASRITTGKILLQPACVDLGALARRVAADFAAEVQGQHHFQVDATSAWVWGDEVRLEQIVSNLVSNAIRYTPPPGVVTVAVAVTETSVVLSVTDTGVGIEPAMLTRMFDLFVQGDRGIERRHGGLGIGLTLVRRLVEMHGGSVEARSEGLGRGTCVIVALPRIAAPAPVAAARRHPDASVSRRVLLVEDNDDARLMLGALLSAAGHHVIESADGPAGLEAAMNCAPDLALVDVGLPGFSGHELARRFRATYPESKLFMVALTGYGQPADRERALAAGFDMHLVKPVNSSEVLALVAEGRTHVG